MWFKKKLVPARAYVFSVDGFSRGQIVWHKLDGTRMVIVGFKWDEYGSVAVCAFSAKCGDEYEFHLAELTAVEPERLAVAPSFSQASDQPVSDPAVAGKG